MDRDSRSKPGKLVRLLRDPRAAARAAHLRYVHAEERGITRRRRGSGFLYLDPQGKAVRDPRTLKRIARLAVPPAWREVWICATEDGHIQATGWDAKGRKQYRYHPAWRGIRDAAKYHHILLFCRALPKLRRRIQRDLEQRALSKEKVIATIVALMQRTQIRVGNERYAQANGSYGLTTLRDQHARISGSAIELKFRGKSGKILHARVRDRKLAAAVKRCRDIPGQILFQYVDGSGKTHPVTSTDVNAYLQQTMGHPFTAKEFRTWAATLLAAVHLSQCEPCSSQTAGKRLLNRITERVAAQLGNTVAVCRKCYIHPEIYDCYLRGELRDKLSAALARARRRSQPGLLAEEIAVSLLLETVAAPLKALALSA